MKQFSVDPGSCNNDITAGDDSATDPGRVTSGIDSSDPTPGTT